MMGVIHSDFLLLTDGFAAFVGSSKFSWMFEEGESACTNEGIFLKRVTILVHGWEIGKPSHITSSLFAMYHYIFIYFSY